MYRYLLLLTLATGIMVSLVCGQTKFESDTLKSRDGNVIMTFLGHGSLIFEFKGKIVYVDPVSRYADFTQMPKADLILVTHEHGDHLDVAAIEKIRTEKTQLAYTQACANSVRGGLVLKNGDERVIQGIEVEAVPAYNIVHMRSEGVPFHSKGSGNGYVMTFGEMRIYVAGDTENIPEMSALAKIDCAFLPMNLPYTMTPEMVAEAAKRIKPKILYPYHYGNTNTAQLVELLKDHKGIEVRIRKLQ
ncbi:MAG: MBL fold metallo-hydrolase [Ignavibacteria bacterium]|nr:MBL fold metallo-hydrolase [Ignavibacteria bacterium]